MKCYLTYLIGFILLFIDFIHTKVLSNDDKIKNTTPEDRYYLIYVNNTHGEYEVFSKTKHQKRQSSQLFIESLVDDIHHLIIENKNTYQNPEKLLEIEETSQLQKRRKRSLQSSGHENYYYTYDESDFVYPISSVNDRVVLYAYLSNKLYQKLASSFNDNIIDIMPNKFSSHLHHPNYNVDDILAETGWKNLTVRENADFHLSLISQGKHDPNLVSRYDNNYYYPSSAGKDVDIVILDSGFNFDYSEFSNRNERTIKCAANVKNGMASTADIDLHCGQSSIYHGEIVSDTAAGLTHGAANLANVYGISLPVSSRGEIADSDIIGGLQFIYETMIRPHHTVINLSLGGAEEDDTSYFKQYQDLIRNIHDKGALIVASAGNDGRYINNASYYIVPCEFDQVICVGGIENDQKGNMEKVYKIAKYSNYGRNVDLYAPFHVSVEVLVNSKIEKLYKKGTSFSSPLVAGLIATIMSEHEDTHYTKESMVEILKENGKDEVVTFYKGSSIIANNGKHIVYSEDDRYYGCGIQAGNRPCE